MVIKEVFLTRSSHKSSTVLFPDSNPLPQLLQTPSGLAILELQGTINITAPQDKAGGVESVWSGDLGLISSHNESESEPGEPEIGRLFFPDYDETDKSNTAWMKRVYFYVGPHQRLTGEVKKLPKAFAVIQRSKNKDTIQNQTACTDTSHNDGENESSDMTTTELEIVDIIKYKIIFANRPEPVGSEISEFV